MSTCWLLPSSTATRIVLLLISTDTWKGREKSISKVPAPFPAALLGLWGQEHSLGMREREEPSACTEGGWESHCCLGANSSEVKGNLSREQQAAQPCRDSHRASVSPYRKPVRRSGAHLLHPSTEGGTALRLPEPSAALPGGLGLPSQEPGVTPAQQQLEAPQLCMAPTPRHSQHWAVAKGQSAGLAAKGCVCVSPRLEGTRQLCYSCSSHTGNPAATRCEVTRPPWDTAAGCPLVVLHSTSSSPESPSGAALHGQDARSRAGRGAQLGAPGAASPHPRGGDCGEICLHSLPEFPQIFLPLCRAHLKCYYIIHYLGDLQ